MMKTGLPMYFHLSSLDSNVVALVALVAFLNINAILIAENDYAL
jgi:hypothetical protein